MYKFLCALIMYIVVISAILTYTVYEVQNTQIEGVTLPSKFFTEKLEFTDINTVSEIFSGKLTMSQYFKLQNNTIVFDNPIPYRYEDIFLLGVQPQSNGNYEISYNFNNPDNSHFRVWVYRAGFLDSDSVYAEFQDSTLYLKKVLPVFTWDTTLVSIPLENPSSGIVKTVYNPNTGYTEIRYNDIVYITSTLDTPKTINHYAGIGVKGYTFTLSGIETPLLINDDEVPSIFEIIGTLLLWNVSEDYIPNWLNVILIKVPIIFLALAIAFYLRGVS